MPTAKKTATAKKTTTKRTPRRRTSVSKNCPNYTQRQLDKIRERAYLIWERNGMPSDTSSADWFASERELIAEGILKKK